MFKVALAAILLSLTTASLARADCASWPTVLANGTTADASQVMGDFNCVLSGLRFTGSVSIGGFSSTGYELDVVGIGRFVSPHIGTTGGVIIRDASGDPSAALLQFVNYENTAQYGFLEGYSGGGLQLGGGNVAVGAIPSSIYTFYVNGSAAGLSAWSNISDGRLKDNVVEINDALNLVEQLRGVRFRWRDPDARSVGQALPLPTAEPQIGLIAQEVNRVVPEAATAPANSGGVWSVKDGVLVAVLVEAIKEQQSEIATLQRQVTQLRDSSAAETATTPVTKDHG